MASSSTNTTTTTTTTTSASASEVFNNLVRQVTDAVKPSLVEACIAAASTISESTQKEFSALSSVQQERRERDASMLQLTQPDNREQFAHASAVMSELENAELALDNSKTEAARASLSKGKKILAERMNLIRLAEVKDWCTVREFTADTRVPLSDEEQKRWRRAVKAVESRASDDVGYRQSNSRPGPYTTQVQRRPSNKINNITCWGCGRQGHVLTTCPDRVPVPGPSPSVLLKKDDEPEVSSG